jgi:predicted RNA-binding Zn ribbon-like protein
MIFDAGPQSGGRTPAPGRLAYVQAFANSFFDLSGEWGADAFATPAALGDWLHARGLSPGTVSAGEHARALALRESLRANFAAHNGHGVGSPLDVAGLPVSYAVGDDGLLVPEPVDGALGALGLVVAIVHEAQLAGTFRRLKACPGHHCGWVFYDSSRNAAGTWCSMGVCGGREKARAYRRRVRGA